MNPFWTPNATIDLVERAGKVDRYGQERWETVATEVRCRLERATRRVRNVQGDTSTIDGTVYLTPRSRLKTGDRLTMRDGEQWVVFNEDEALDAAEGRPEYYIYGLVRQREAS